MIIVPIKITAWKNTDPSWHWRQNLTSVWLYFFHHLDSCPRETSISIVVCATCSVLLCPVWLCQIDDDFFNLICFCFIYLHLPLQLDELSRPPYDSVTVTKPQNMADLHRTLTSASSINFRRHCYADWTAGPAPLRRCWTWWTPADTLENLVERLNLHFWNEIQKSQTSGCPHTLGQECIHAGSLFESHFNFHLFVCKIFSKQPRWQIWVQREIEKAKI